MAGLGGFGERSSVRTWLYRVATNRCLNSLRDGPRRPPFTGTVPPTVMWPEPSRLSEVVWLEPFADFTLDDVADPALGPETRYEAREAISLAFIAALQHLPPRQRAVLVLRDVLGYHTAEVADMLESTEDSVNSALKRARAALDGRLQASRQREPAPLPRSPAEEALVERFTNAFVAGDVAGVVALLTEDVQLTMPPIPLEYYGRELVAHFHSSVVFQGGRRYQLVATRANRQPAFGLYVTDHHAAHCPLQWAARPHVGRTSDLRPDPLRQQRPPPLRPASYVGGLLTDGAKSTATRRLTVHRWQQTTDAPTAGAPVMPGSGEAQQSPLIREVVSGFNPSCALPHGVPAPSAASPPRRRR